MDSLSNAFAVLELDAEDNQVLPPPPPSPPPPSSNSGDGKNQKKSKLDAEDNQVLPLPPRSSSNSGDGKNQKKSKAPPSELEYRMPLVWIDLEMTGLNIEVDRILEIACIVTDGTLTKTVEGPDLVIHQSKECLDSMGEWCQSHHAASGLTKRVLESSMTEREAEMQVIDFVKKNVGTYTPLLAGNSVYVDFTFLKKYMPDLAGLFSHVVVDVSSVKALCIRWYPRDNKKAPSKENKHRALDDIRESIAELKYFKENIFKPRSKK